MGILPPLSARNCGVTGGARHLAIFGARSARLSHDNPHYPIRFGIGWVCKGDPLERAATWLDSELHTLTIPTQTVRCGACHGGGFDRLGPSDIDLCLRARLVAYAGPRRARPVAAHLAKHGINAESGEKIRKVRVTNAACKDQATFRHCTFFPKLGNFARASKLSVEKWGKYKGAS